MARKTLACGCARGSHPEHLNACQPGLPVVNRLARH